MRTIWKFPLEFVNGPDGWLARVTMPRGATVVHFAHVYRGPLDNGPRKGEPTIWAEVDPTAPNERATFQIFGTGDDVPDAAYHVATWDAEPFVWHLYDMRYALTIPAALRPMLPDQAAVNAYRLLVKDGFALRDDKAWLAPDDEPLTTEQMLAVAELQEHGFGAVV